MGQEIYSKLGSIPTGYAPDRIVEGCLVLEGGAFREIGRASCRERV